MVVELASIRYDYLALATVLVCSSRLHDFGINHISGISEIRSLTSNMQILLDPEDVGANFLHSTTPSFIHHHGFTGPFARSFAGQPVTTDEKIMSVC